MTFEQVKGLSEGRKVAFPLYRPGSVGKVVEIIHATSGASPMLDGSIIVEWDNGDSTTFTPGGAMVGLTLLDAS